MRGGWREGAVSAAGECAPSDLAAEERPAGGPRAPGPQPSRAAWRILGLKAEGLKVALRIPAPSRPPWCRLSSEAGAADPGG